MRWWEIQRVVLVVGAVAVVGLGVALAGSALFGGVTRSSLTLWLVLLALPMMLSGGANAGTVTFRSQWLGNAYGEYMGNDQLARQMDENRQHEIDQGVRLSWTTAIALAGVALLVAAGVVTLA